MIRKHISRTAATGAMLVALVCPALAAEPAKTNPPSTATEEVITVPVEAELRLQTEEQKILYTLGLALAQNVTRLDLEEPELAYVVKGLQDGVLGREAQVALAEYAPKLQELAQQRIAAASQREQTAAHEYLAERAAEPGAVRTDSGIVVLSRRDGTGPSPTKTDTVRVNYEGTLPDGTTFDSSIQREQPATFAVDEVIPCWTEVVQTMKVGGRVKVICPPGLAYGSEGRPGIPPNSPLIFDIHLLGIGDTQTTPGREGEVEVDPLLQQVAMLNP